MGLGEQRWNEVESTPINPSPINPPEFLPVILVRTIKECRSVSELSNPIPLYSVDWIWREKGEESRFDVGVE